MLSNDRRFCFTFFILFLFRTKLNLSFIFVVLLAVVVAKSKKVSIGWIAIKLPVSDLLTPMRWGKTHRCHNSKMRELVFSIIRFH